MMLSYDETLLRMRMSVVIRRVRPHVIVTHFPFANWRLPPTCNGQCPDGTNGTSQYPGWNDYGYFPGICQSSWLASCVMCVHLP